MIEITRDEGLAILDELSALPYRDVQGLIFTLADKLSKLEEPQEKQFQEKIYTGE
tara:strand:- start:899 stop:1063 length:165 start_codon:yes stop_codon:yes gene_type:complete